MTPVRTQIQPLEKISPKRPVFSLGKSAVSCFSFFCIFRSSLQRPQVILKTESRHVCSQAEARRAGPPLTRTSSMRLTGKVPSPPKHRTHQTARRESPAPAPEEASGQPGGPACFGSKDPGSLSEGSRADRLWRQQQARGARGRWLAWPHAHESRVGALAFTEAAAVGEFLPWESAGAAHLG